MSVPGVPSGSAPLGSPPAGPVPPAIGNPRIPPNPSNPPPPANAIDLLALIQNMLQTVIANQPGGPRQPSTFNNINMIKFSDPNRFTGKSQDVESFVKTIDNCIFGSPGTFTADFQMTAYFASWLGP